MSKFYELEQEIKNCNQCPFKESTDVRYCGGTGTDHRVMFIAESPSTRGGVGLKKADDNYVSNYADALFDEVRDLFGLLNCYRTDFVKCGRANGKPTEENANNCIEHLRREVELVKPKVIVAVGKSFTVQIAGGKRKSYDFAGYIRERLKPNVPVVSTYHYSYVWRWKKMKGVNKNAKKMDQIKEDARIEYMEQHKQIQKELL